MDQTDRTHVVWLTATLLSFPLLTLCDPLCILSAPQILRVGTRERVFVQVQDYQGQELSGHVTVFNFPSKDTELSSSRVTLKSTQFQSLVDIQIHYDEAIFNSDSKEKQFVYLKANFPTINAVMEKLVMVSFQSGYIFLQTDKTIYTPDSTVQYRVFALDAEALPVRHPVLVEIVTPDGITISSSLYQPGTKKIEEHKLGSPVSTGTWKIAASFKNNPRKNFTTEFEVKEYVLPTFEVHLEPVASFFYIDDKEFSVSIRAKYLFGKDVEGSAFVVFGVFNENKKINIRSSLTRVKIHGGKGTAKLTQEQMLQTFPKISDLKGKMLYISVSILTDTGSEMVEAERRGIYIVESPYEIHFTKTPQFFKPGLPFHLMVYVTNPDRTPAEDIEISATPGNLKTKTGPNGVAQFTINTPQASTSLSFTVKTEVERLTNERQAKKTMTAKAYISVSEHYLHLDIPSGELKLGSSFHIKLHFGSRGGNEVVTLLILSKGQIVHAQSEARNGSTVFAVPIDITKEMLPSFRVVAFYRVGSSEIVSDSVWVDLKDSCMGTLEVTKETTDSYEPTDEMKIKITGNPKAHVSLVAVDKGIYVLNKKNRLTQSKIWDTIEEHDVACTAGSGKDSMGVFYDAGLLFISNSAGSTTDRRDFSCGPVQTRRRRDVTVSQLRRTLVEAYNETLKQCCVDGMVENLLGYTCERRAEYVEDGPECREAFLHCCSKLANLKAEVVQEELHLARNEVFELDPDGFEEETSRSVFPESWMMDDIQLPACTDNKKCVLSETFSRHLPESITTWVITAISMSDDYGICVADPYEVYVTKKFFIDLKLPYSAVVNEQIEIKAILHNLSENQFKKIDVYLKETASICSMASRKQKHRITVSMDRKSSRSVSFVIIPLVVGDFDIEVKAFTSSGISDGVLKKLKVVTQGVLTTTGETTLILDPTNHGGVQRSEIKRPFLDNQMPDTKAHTYIAVTGRPLTQLINDAISGKGLEKLIKMPSGCGEQNLLRMALPVIATYYLDKTNKWNDVGEDQRSKALGYISQGFETELTYRIPNNSFSIWRGSPGSTWLTAYVVRVFSMASDLVTIDKSIICDAMKWLILNTQMPSGMFREVYSVSSSAMGGKDSGLTMTSFVLIAMQEGDRICGRSVTSLQGSMDKAVRYIEQNIGSTSNPYPVAIASYALANTGKLNHDRLLQFASPDATHWPISDSHLFTLEATGYALLALLKDGDFTTASPIVNWLKTNQIFGGGDVSTQATVVVFEALAKYTAEKPKAPPIERDMNVIVTSTAKSTSFKGLFSKTTRGLQRSDKFPAGGDLTVTASGHGEGSIRVVTLYYTRPDKNATKCKNFELDVNITRNRETSYDQALRSYTLSIETKFLNKEREAAMTILDVGMLTGFVPDMADLENLMRKDKYIDGFEMDKQLSERGSLIIYLKQVSNKRKEKIAFKVHQMLNTNHPQPAGVTIYEYYATENRCVMFYDTSRERASGLLYTICPKEVCTCAEENCPTLKADAPKTDIRNRAACSSNDYVYKAAMKDVRTSDNTDIYTFTIVKMLKEGTDRNVVGKTREFSVHHRCSTKLGLKVKDSYLIMGPEPEKVGTSFRYMFTAETWIEYWPTSSEGQEKKDNNNLRYNGLKELEHIFQEEGGCMT
ncbi:complement C3-like [Brachyhypopomus gauderio]|uniref:complement C3-like n=1 Tax=Brachyhypopomus gauderio TaxID=698409 RepID=UPI0040423EA1